ncbi:fibropellin-1-like [Branchiostoma lanceolatum]|uniref:fibropellin-1-like n=1 Tax=Branchiostoma lanceolatum TaxID=7740 RepID=UPI0034567696
MTAQAAWWLRWTGLALIFSYSAAVCPLVNYASTSIDGYCYREKVGQFDFHAAEDICAADGALLITDKNPYRHMWLQLKDFAQGFWLGLQDEDVHGEYFWSDGEPLTQQTYWEPTIPDDPNKHCVISVRLGVGGVTEQSNWANADCHNYTTNVVCEIDNDECADPAENACDGEPNMHCVNTVGWYECECDAGYHWEGNICAEEHVGPTEAPVVDECPVGWDDSFTGMCIKAFDINANWPMAHHTCGTKERGRLVTIEDQDKLDFMISYAGAPNYYWIGLNDVFDEGTLVWTDGDELDPAEFTSGIPWNSDPNHQNTGAIDCVCFAKAILNGEFNTWAFEGCLTKKKFICEIDIDECKAKPCLNNGTCHEEHPVGYSCTCAPGFEGDHCETDIDECVNVTCLNDGTCIDGINDYTCNCTDGFEGDLCEINIDDCIGVTCQNGGTCVDGLSDYSCDCADGYGGDHCETEADECDPNPCQNGGTCTDLFNDFNCSCATGWEGDTCETDIDDCASVTCQNGGTCIDGVDNYGCDCVPGYDGDHCENDIDDCVSVTCQNGGTCVDGVDSYGCDCVAGYDGDHCENAVDYCSSDPCLNGGTCEDDGNGYTCTCAPNYDGVHCEIGCEDGYWLYNGRCYWFSPFWHEYSDAEDVCAARNAIMATVKDAATHSFLSTQIQSTQDGKSHWIGLTDRVTDGVYEWADGTTLGSGSYQPWRTGEFGFGDHSNKGCVILWHRMNFSWATTKCQHRWRLHFICEKAAVTTTP